MDFKLLGLALARPLRLIHKKREGGMLKPTKTFRTWCEEHSAYELLCYYEAAGNQLPADSIGFSAARKVDFLCTVCGYRWRRTLNKATRKGAAPDCPSCNDRLRPGGYTLVDRYPELVEQWCASNAKGPGEYSLTSPKERQAKVNWFCKRCRNQWQAVIRDRVKTADRVRRNGGALCPFCGHQKISAAYNLFVLHPEVARQWDYIKNGEMLPEDCFPAGSQKVNWVCDFDPSHRWEDTIGNRTVLRRGCPYCSRAFKMTYPSRVLFYYLRTVFPDCVCEYPEGKYRLDICLTSRRIAIEHHGYTHARVDSQKRDVRRKQELLKLGYTHVLWLVESKQVLEEYHLDGDVLHYYDPAPYYKLDKLVSYVLNWLGMLTGEPIYYEPPNYVRDHHKIEQLYYHERKKRSLAVGYPELAKEWSDKNGSPADTIMPGSGRYGIWNCGKCGREFRATVANRAKNGSGCSHCARRLYMERNNAALKYPHLLNDWDWENNDKTLHELLPSTDYPAVWMCSQCGHRWKTMLFNRARKNGSGCPVCRQKHHADRSEKEHSTTIITE